LDYGTAFELDVGRGFQDGPARQEAMRHRHQVFLIFFFVVAFVLVALFLLNLACGSIGGLPGGWRLMHR
jgi:hypothetical protein